MNQSWEHLTRPLLEFCQLALQPLSMRPEKGWIVRSVLVVFAEIPPLGLQPIRKYRHRALSERIPYFPVKVESLPIESSQRFLGQSLTFVRRAISCSG